MDEFQIGDTVRTKEDTPGYEGYIFLGDVVDKPPGGTFDDHDVFVRCDYTDYRPDDSIGEVFGFHENELEYIG